MSEAQYRLNVKIPRSALPRLREAARIADCSIAQLVRYRLGDLLRDAPRHDNGDQKGPAA